MKTLKIILTLSLLSLLVMPVLVGAQPNVQINDFADAQQKIGALLWQIVGIVALVLFVIAGITFMTAAGDPEKIKTARNFVLYGVIGIIVAILAYTIVAVVESLL